MNRIYIENPKGIVPGLAGRNLPQNFAQVATNCNFKKGVLNPVADLKTAATFSDPGALRSLYKYESKWAYWTDADINAIRLQLAASDDRVMYTGDGYPKQFDSNIMSATGIPRTYEASISGATQANPVIITTSTAHGYSSSDYVYISGVVGMTELNGREFLVGAGVTEFTFSLSGENGTTHTAYTSGGTVINQTKMDYRRVGIPAPTAAPSSVTQFGTGDGKTKYTVSYVYTYVCKWSDGTEEESPPSAATTPLDIEGNSYIRLVSPTTKYPVQGVYGNDITHVRVYRLVATGESAVYRQVKMRNTSAAETTDFWYDIPIVEWYDVGAISLYDSDGTTGDIWDNSADNAIQTTDWDNPPTDLAGLVQYQNGILAGFSGRKVCISEPFVFYAWPESYQLEVDYDIVALGVYNRSLVVTTDAYPYIIYGTNTSTLGKDRLPFLQKNLSARGTVSTDIGVMYPCPDGIFLINYSEGWGGSLVSKNIITKDEWEALPPTGKTLADIVAFYYDDIYYAFFSGTNKGFAFNFREDPYFKKILIDKNVYHGIISEEDDDLILLTNTGGDDYYADEMERASSYIAFDWKSKEFETTPVSMSACKINGNQSDVSPLVLIPYGNGTQLQRKYVASSSLPTAIAEWKFNGDALDSVGSYDATLTAGKWGPGPTGFALDLNGSSSYADLSDPFESLLQASFGIELFFNADDGRPATDEYLFGCTDLSVSNYIWATIATTGKINFYYSADGDSVSVVPDSASLQDGLTGLQHVIFTISSVSGNAFTYLNGVLIKTTPITGITMGDYAQDTNNLIAGANNYQGTPTGFFDGRIANMRLYNSVITAEQALALYNNVWFKEVSDKKVFRLPGIGIYETHAYRGIGKTELKTITIATSPDEL